LVIDILISQGRKKGRGQPGRARPERTWAKEPKGRKVVGGRHENNYFQDVGKIRENTRRGVNRTRTPLNKKVWVRVMLGRLRSPGRTKDKSKYLTAERRKPVAAHNDKKIMWGSSSWNAYRRRKRIEKGTGDH